MTTIVRLAIPSLVAAMLLVACATTSHRSAPSVEIMGKIGLPLYPHPVRLLPAQESTTISPLGAWVTVSQPFETNDPLDRVKQYYEGALPSSIRRTAMPMGRGVIIQFSRSGGQKQVVILALGGITFVTLQSTSLRLPGATAAPTPHWDVPPGFHPKG